MAHIDHGPLGAVDRRRRAFSVLVRDLGDDAYALIGLFPAAEARILDAEVRAVLERGEARDWSIDEYLDTLSLVLIVLKAGAPFAALESDDPAGALLDLAEADPRLVANLARTNPFSVLDRLTRSDLEPLFEHEERSVREAAIRLLAVLRRSDDRAGECPRP